MAKSNPLTFRELNDLLPRLQATMALLLGGARRGRPPGSGKVASAAPAAAKPDGRRGPRGRRKRGASGDLDGSLMALLKRSKSGLSLGQIVAQSGSPRSAVKYNLRKLRASKEANVVGDRKQAKWFAVK